MNRRRVLEGAVALAAGSLTACASPMDGTITPMAQRHTVRIAHISNLFEYSPVWIAVDRGYFADEGIDARFDVLGSVPRVTELTRSGEYQVGIGVPEGVVADAEAGGPLRLFGGLSRKVAVSLITAPRFKRIADLKGARLGVSGLKEGTGILMRDVVAAHGLQPDDIQLVVAGIHTARWEKLQSGEIDAGLQPFPYNLMAQAKGFNNLAEFPDLVPAYQFIALAAHQTWLNEHTEVAARTLRAIGRGVRTLHTERDYAVELAMRQTQTDRDAMQRTWAYYTQGHVIEPQAHVDVAALSTTLQVMVKAASLAPERATQWQRYVDLRPAQFKHVT